MAKAFRKNNETKKIKVCKRGSACQAIGQLEKNTDIFILTYGQFSLVDALMEILSQTGPAHVSISTWTAAHAHLDKTQELLSLAGFLSFRMIVDRSFRTRQPKYFNHMVEIFGIDSIRSITTHAKFLLIRNDKWDIVVRTSMNLNENPRMENIEISENRKFADFFEEIVDGIFSEVSPGESRSITPDLKNLEESEQFNLVTGQHINITKLKEPKYTHEIKN